MVEAASIRRRVPVLVTLSVLLLCLPAMGEEEDVGLDASAAEARALLEAGKALEAVDLLKAVLAVERPAAGRAPLEALLGTTLLQMGEPYTALRWLEAAVRDRGEAEDHLALAEALLAVGRENAQATQPRWLDVGPYLEDAVASAEAAEGASLDGRRRQIVGEARYWLGDPAAALEAWGDETFGDRPEAELQRLADVQARALYAVARYAESAEAFRRAGSARGEASAWAAAGEGGRAVAVYGRLLKAEPGSEALLDEAIAAARYAGAEAELAGVLSELEVEGQALARVLVARALLAEATGNLDAAARFVERARTADPQGFRPRYEEGRLGLRRAVAGDEDARDTAIAALVAALERSPGDERVRQLLWSIAGSDYARAWRSERARTRSLRIQEALAAVSPDDGLAWANLGNTRRIAGHLQDALVAYDRALAADPHDPSMVSDRGLVLSALGRSEAALEAFERAVAMDPTFDAARQNAARLLWLGGRDDEADAHLAAAERTTRAAGRGWMRYRFLQDRVYRTRKRAELR